MVGGTLRSRLVIPDSTVCSSPLATSCRLELGLKLGIVGIDDRVRCRFAAGLGLVS